MLNNSSKKFKQLFLYLLTGFLLCVIFFWAGWMLNKKGDLLAQVLFFPVTLFTIILFLIFFIMTGLLFKNYILNRTTIIISGVILTIVSILLSIFTLRRLSGLNIFVFIYYFFLYFFVCYPVLFFFFAFVSKKRNNIT